MELGGRAPQTHLCAEILLFFIFPGAARGVTGTFPVFRLSGMDARISQCFQYLGRNADQPESLRRFFGDDHRRKPWPCVRRRALGRGNSAFLPYPSWRSVNGFGGDVFVVSDGNHFVGTHTDVYNNSHMDAGFAKAFGDNVGDGIFWPPCRWCALDRNGKYLCTLRGTPAAGRDVERRTIGSFKGYT